MDKLDDLLSRIRWKQRDLASQIEVSPETVSRWVRGKRETPKVVILYLELLAEGMKV